MNEELKREIELKKKKSFVMENLFEIHKYLDNPLITEISRNQDGKIWIDKLGTGYEDTGNKMSDINAENIIKVVASYVGKNVTRENPIVSARLPNGERFEGLLFEVVNNKPVFSIRKKSNKIFTLDEFVKLGTITEKQKEYIVKSIREKKNILIIGGTSSGKTTFLNACLQELNSFNERIHILEEVNELSISTPNANFFESTENCSFLQLLRSNMRLNMDRIILGELRKGEETIELLKAWNSGHSGGLSTIHANDNEAGLKKLEQYLAEITEVPQQMMIVQAIDVLVNIVKENNIRKVKEVSEVIDFDNRTKKYILNKIE